MSLIKKIMKNDKKMAKLGLPGLGGGRKNNFVSTPRPQGGYGRVAKGNEDGDEIPSRRPKKTVTTGGPGQRQSVTTGARTGGPTPPSTVRRPTMVTNPPPAVKRSAQANMAALAGKAPKKKRMY